MVLRFLVVLVLLSGVVAGCRSDDPEASPSQPPVTPVERLNTAQMALPRIDFCSLVPEAAVGEVLGTEKFTASGWDNGERAPLGDDTTDVVAEHLCEWTSRDEQATARAWMFARPVDRRLARQAVRQQSGRQGCRTPGQPRFGRPSVLQVCTAGKQHRVRRAGLFGDTWFTCELQAAAEMAQVRERTDVWCSRLVSLLNTTR